MLLKKYINNVNDRLILLYRLSHKIFWPIQIIYHINSILIKRRFDNLYHGYMIQFRGGRKSSEYFFKGSSQGVGIFPNKYLCKTHYSLNE